MIFVQHYSSVHSVNYIFCFTELLYLLPEENRLLITANGCFD